MSKRMAEALAYTVSVMEKEIEELRAENEKLKEALRFYAHKKHFARDMILDEGNIARAALEVMDEEI